MILDEEAWKAAVEAAKDELALAYASGTLDIPQPVDQNLNKLATTIVRRVATSL